MFSISNWCLALTQSHPQRDLGDGSQGLLSAPPGLVFAIIGLVICPTEHVFMKCLSSRKSRRRINELSALSLRRRFCGMVWTLPTYFLQGERALQRCFCSGPDGKVAPNTDAQFMDSTLVNLFKYSSGQDLMKAINNLNIDSGMLATQKTCL
ncbi:hypothetical protein HD554DRAFT_2165640 [Boletus coccyginus]|nr:hypothetical protein HD554DRAFT_2165640 [Boletus coccyginus]